jgi:hypothetical protein
MPAPTSPSTAIDVTNVVVPPPPPPPPPQAASVPRHKMGIMKRGNNLDENRSKTRGKNLGENWDENQSENRSETDVYAVWHGIISNPFDSIN